MGDGPCVHGERMQDCPRCAQLLKFAQAMSTREIVVCNTCNVVLGRDGEQVDRRPTVPCSHLNTSAFVSLDAVVEALEDYGQVGDAHTIVALTRFLLREFGGDDR